MRFGLITAALGMTAMLGTGMAEAAPMNVAPLATRPAPTTPAVLNGPAANLIFVRGGCGFGEHRTFRGRCHYNYGVRGAIRRHRNHVRHRFYR